MTFARSFARSRRRAAGSRRKDREMLAAALGGPGAFDVIGAIEEQPAGLYVVRWAVPDHGVVFGDGVVVVAGGCFGVVHAVPNPRVAARGATALAVWQSGWRMVCTGERAETGDAVYRFEKMPPVWRVPATELVAVLRRREPLNDGCDEPAPPSVLLELAEPGEPRLDLPGAIVRACALAGGDVAVMDAAEVA